MNENYEFENVYSKNLYCFFTKNNFFVPLSPFFIFLDNQYFYHTGVDNKSHPVYSEIFSTRCISIPKYENAFQQLIEDDLNLLKSSEISNKLTSKNNVFHNLSPPLYTRFVGRDETIDTIIKALKHLRTYLISINGIGGIGKSAITIKTAEDLVEYESTLFSYIIGVSAKKTYLATDGKIKSETQIFSNLIQLLDVILKITGFHEYLKYTTNVKKQLVLEILLLDKFLIILDNFETLPNPSEFLNFFEEIGNQYLETKIIITSRHQYGSCDKIINLKELQYSEFVDIINNLFDEKFQIDGKVHSDEIKTFFKITGGLSLATEFFVGQISQEYPRKKNIKEN